MVFIMRFLILFILTFSSSRADRDIIPVFLIDYDLVMAHINIEANPFSKLSTSQFSDIVHDSIKRSDVVIIFVEDQFSVEDVTTKDHLGTPYHNLHVGVLENKVKYFPGVIEPYKLLNQIFQPHPFNVYHLDTRTKLQVFDEYYKYFYVFFQDGKNETRAETLRKHDFIMREVFHVVRRLTPRTIVAFYTGKRNPVVVERVQFVPIEPIRVIVDPGVMVVTDGALFRFVGVFAATQTRRSMFNQVPMVAEETWSHQSLSTKMAYSDFELEFSFTFKDKEWVLEHVGLLEGGEEVGRTVMGVGAGWDWAYYCGEPLVLVNKRDGTSVTISEYQIQPLRYRRRYRSDDEDDDVGNGKDSDPSISRNDGLMDDENKLNDEDGSGDGKYGNESNRFGKSVNCGPYYTSSILAGLFVVAICLGILSFGLIVLSDCHSNDRFEDPQGKPLVIHFEGLH